MTRIAILTTGGTIEKTYNEADGSLRNTGSVLEEILGRLRLPSLTLCHTAIMSKDSIEMTDADRDRIVAGVRAALTDGNAVIIVHGTDTLAITGERLCRELGPIRQPVILTGAMRPFQFRDTDAFQNLTEALLAARLAPPGVHVVIHNQVLTFPGVVKDRERGTFARTAIESTDA